MARIVKEYMQWHPFFEKVKNVTGERAAMLFALSVSNGSNCPLYCALFNKMISESNQRTDANNINEHEKELIEFGEAIARHKGCIANHVYNSVAIYYTEEEMVSLIAFAGQLIAASMFNNVIETEIDSSLIPYLPSKYYMAG